jgi:hypothetical protein
MKDSLQETYLTIVEGIIAEHKNQNQLSAVFSFYFNLLVPGLMPEGLYTDMNVLLLYIFATLHCFKHRTSNYPGKGDGGIFSKR